MFLCPWDWRSYLLLVSAVAADGPQVLEGPPHQDDEEPPKEGDHGRGEESPPHALAVAVARHVGREGDDDVHLGHVHRRLRAQPLAALRHVAAGRSGRVVDSFFFFFSKRRDPPVLGGHGESAAELRRLPSGRKSCLDAAGGAPC